MIYIPYACFEERSTEVVIGLGLSWTSCQVNWKLGRSSAYYSLALWPRMALLEGVSQRGGDPASNHASGNHTIHSNPAEPLKTQNYIADPLQLIHLHPTHTTVKP